LAFAVDDIHETCSRLMEQGIVINRPPRDGQMAFIRSPDNISIELLQKGQPLEPVEPWLSMGNTGEW
jgi:lactoylglutathione lyase